MLSKSNFVDPCSLSRRDARPPPSEVPAAALAQRQAGPNESKRSYLTITLKLATADLADADMLELPPSSMIADVD